MRARAPTLSYLSLDDFEELLPDKPENERWELIGGRVVKMMVGARWEHGRIVQNVARALENAFDAAGSPCQTFAETFYVKPQGGDAALLPDVLVVCGDLEEGALSTDSPVVIFEILSTGTEARDRVNKWYVYQRIPSLRHYVLVSRDKPHAEVYDRVDGTWQAMHILDGLEAVIELPAVGVRLTLGDVYRRVLAA
jgi:Uma2 family endonuclease